MESRMLWIPSGSGRLQKEETEPAKARGVSWEHLPFGQKCRKRINWEIGLDGGFFDESPQKSCWARLPPPPAKAKVMGSRALRGFGVASR